MTGDGRNTLEALPLSAWLEDELSRDIPPSGDGEGRVASVVCEGIGTETAGTGPSEGLVETVTGGFDPRVVERVT